MWGKRRKERERRWGQEENREKAEVRQTGWERGPKYNDGGHEEVQAERRDQARERPASWSVSLPALDSPVKLAQAMCALGLGLQFWCQKHKPEGGRGMGPS